MGLLALWGASALFMAGVMSVAWLVQRRTGQGGWADVFWSYGLGAAGVGVALYPLAGSAPTIRQIIVALLIGLWGLRLGSHIAARAAHEAEDARYARLRSEWGTDYPAKMYAFLMLQAGAAAFLVLSVLLAARNPAQGFGVQDIVAALVFITALVGEAVSDKQLALYKAKPAPKPPVCDTGLWAWSRHPNYFFEWLGWCAWPLFAISLSPAWPWGWLALTAPAYIYWLLNHVSGVPLLEQHMQRTRPDAFAEYSARTSRFFLRPPRA